MLAPMNHREIEYQSHRIWERLSISMEETVQGLFDEWDRQPEKSSHASMQKLKAKELMNWLAETGQKVFAEDLLMDYGYDCLRSYLLFEKTPKADDTYLDTWEECSLEGVYKFLGKYRRMVLVASEHNRRGGYAGKSVQAELVMITQMKQEMMEHISKGNTMPNRHNALSVLMTGIHTIQKGLGIGQLVKAMHLHDIEEAVPHQADKKAGNLATEDFEQNSVSQDDTQENQKVRLLCRELVILLAPFAPCLAENLWYTLKEKEPSVLQCAWCNEQSVKSLLTLPLQINGKTKRILQMPSGMAESDIEAVARREAGTFLNPDKQYRCIYVPDKIINFVS